MQGKRSDSIANAIEELILNGTFVSDTRLDEVQLAKQFQVSRTPIREAFHTLAQSGLVDQVPHKGVFVRQPGPVELLEMFEVMAELEAVCAKLAASRISNEAIQDLQTANAKCNFAVEADDADTYYQENEHFHAIIYRQSGNSFLEQECLKLQRRLRPYRRVQLRLRGRLRQSMTEHETIVAALVDGDSENASNAIRAHVSVQGEKFYRLLASLKQAAE